MIGRLARAISVLVLISLASADWPPGYEFIQITDSPQPDSRPRLNSYGDVVFWTQTRDSKRRSDIVLYHEGALTWITDDQTPDGWPVINDSGTIVWSRFSGPDNVFGPTAEIVRWKNGTLDYLTDNDVDDYVPALNNAGHISWFRSMYDGCSGTNRTVEFFDGNEITELTDGETDDQVGAMNDHDEIVWTRYDNCVEPWNSEIILWDGRDAQSISGDQYATQLPAINNNGLVAWHYSDTETGERYVVLYDHGDLQTLCVGSSPRLNDHGDVLYSRWDEEHNTWQMSAYLRGEFSDLTAGDIYNAQGDINNRTDIVWVNKKFPDYDIVMLKRLPFGDMNCDKQVNFDDIDGFVAALIGIDAFLQIEPDCDWWLADMNDDRKIDFNDIDPFVTCLINNGCP